MVHHFRRGILACAFAAAVVTPSVAAVAAPVLTSQGSGGLRVESVSNPRPDMVSGEQVLLRVTAGPAENPASVHVERDGEDVTDRFVAQPDGSLLGLVDGLGVGDNTVTATVDDDAAQLTVVDHPLQGPIFSGPQQTPFVCQTADSGLGAATGPGCSAPTRVSYRYKSTNGGFKDLPDPTSPRRDLATTVVAGRTVPYIVRIETGVIDRGIYQISALWDGADPSPTRADTSWNGRLIFSFGGGCAAGYQQGKVVANGTGLTNDAFFAAGYAVASSTLDVAGTNCGPVLAAEAAMMVKEHFGEEYGPIVHTIGFGGSGGTILQFAAVESYPGILDGIVPSLPFPDGAGTLMQVDSDCVLLENYFGRRTAADGSRRGFTPDQQTAVAGYLKYLTCTNINRQEAPHLGAVAGCPKIVPTSYWWNAISNPDGIKCSVDAQNVTQLGVDPGTGFPNAYRDNVGVQYGLAPLLSGVITASQFVALNRSIGSIDERGVISSQRGVASDAGLAAMYDDDLIMTGTQGLRSVPIIDLRSYVDVEGSGHTSEWSFVVRQRLEEAGGAGNQAIIMLQDRAPDVSAFAVATMDHWLDTLAADTSDLPVADKVVAAKPAGFGDGCFLGDPARYVREDLVYQGDTGPCAQNFPVKADPRLVAGQPLDLLALKCALKPLDRADYPGITFRAADWASLVATFPQGVCDWSAPGVGQHAPAGTWLDYSDAAPSGWG